MVTVTELDRRGVWITMANMAYPILPKVDVKSEDANEASRRTDDVA